MKFNLEDIDFPEDVCANRGNRIIITEKRIAVSRSDIRDKKKNEIYIIDISIIKRIRLKWREDTGALLLAKIFGVATLFSLIISIANTGILHQLWILSIILASASLYYLAKWQGSKIATIDFLQEYGEKPVLTIPVSNYETAVAFINDFLACVEKVNESDCNKH